MGQQTAAAGADRARAVPALPIAALPALTIAVRPCRVSVQGGITTADRVVTVSPGYAGEIRTYLGGWGLEGLIDSRAYVLNGIVNGIDDE